MADPPGRRWEWVVAAADAGQRLDHYLTRREVLGSRSQVTRLIAEGAVRVDGRAVKAGAPLRAGARVVAERRVEPDSGPRPEAIALDVLYEDEWLLAIDKPAGLVVHPAPGHWQGTLVNALLHRWPGSAASGLAPDRLGIVHRLDKDTSGVLLIARTAAALAELGRQFKGREVRKQYLALVYGSPRRTQGTIREPIGRHPVDRKRMAVRAGGRAAVTGYEVLERFRAVSLVRAHPETGRTHQIRVHFGALGHPIVADPLYARGRPNPVPGLTRQALHAEAISFRHPITAVPTTIRAPLAPDMAEALRGLGCVLTS
jgi:23S rRNA pseudouridine1911/1915/1917 synthase